MKRIHLSERAKAFWEKQDVDDVFNQIFGKVDHLRRALMKNAATDKGRASSAFQDDDQNASSVFMLENLMFVHQNTSRA